MFDDILKKENDFALICCASCVHSARARSSKCPKDYQKCCNEGEIMEYKGWGRFNPTYRYSLWEPIK